MKTSEYRGYEKYVLHGPGTVLYGMRTWPELQMSISYEAICKFTKDPMQDLRSKVLHVVLRSPPEVKI